MKKLLVSGLTGEIYLTDAKENKDGILIGFGEKKQMTEEAIKAVFQHMNMKALQENKKICKITIEGYGKLVFEREETK